MSRSVIPIEGMPTEVRRDGMTEYGWVIPIGVAILLEKKLAALAKRSRARRRKQAGARGRIIRRGIS